MLHPFDDYPLHQTPEPLLHTATESANAYDRFFYNGFTTDGGLFFAVALGVYPNRGVMDAAFSVVRDGVQTNLRSSRRCSSDRITRVGPIEVSVIDPMRVHRIVVDSADGVAADLTWTAFSPPIEEPRFVRHDGRALLFDYTRLTQFGSWTGSITVDGITHPLGAGRGTTTEALGCRDRSWGVRGVGEDPPGPRPAPQYFWIWAPTIFADRCTHVALNHDALGRPWHQSGAVVERCGPRAADELLDPQLLVRGHRVDLDVEWQTGTRWAKRITTTMHRFDAEPVEVAYEPLLRFQMSGIGYRHPDWGHGMWRGNLETTRDDQDLARIDPEESLNVHIQALSRARWGDRVGIGVVEQMILGPHAPTGLTSGYTGWAPGPDAAAGARPD